MKKRIVSFLLIVVMLVTIVPFQAEAKMQNVPESEAADNGIDYYTAWFHISADGYDAYHWLNKLSNVLAHNIWQKDAENNWHAKTALSDWRILTFNLTSEVEFSADEKALYETLLFDMVLGDNGSISNAELSAVDPDDGTITDSIAFEALQLSDTIYKTVFESCKESYNNDYNAFIRQVKITYSDAGKDILYQHMEEALEEIKNSNQNILVATMLENILDLVAYGVDIYEALERVSKYEAMLELDQATFDVLYQMSQSAGSSQASQRAAEAALDMWKIYDERSDELAEVVIGDLAQNKVLNVGTQLLWETLGKKAPVFIGIDMGQKVGTFAANILTGTDELGASLYALEALDGFERCINNTMVYYRNQFIDSGSLEDARAFNAAARMYAQFIKNANEYAKQHVEIIFNSGIVNSIYGYFHQDTYDAYQSYFTSMDEAIDGFEYDSRAASNYYSFIQNIETYYITYDANDGYGAPAPQENTDTITIPNVEPVRTGYYFLGWATSRTASNAQYHPGDAVSLSGDVTLYAIWEPGVFDIVFHANDGRFPQSGTDTITRQKTYLQPFLIDVEKPERDGYTFGNAWSLYPDGSGTTYTQGVSHSDIGGAGLGAKHLYAVWTDTEAEVLYDYGDDPTCENVTTTTEKVDISNGSVTYSIKDATEINTYNGNAFKGWMYQDINGSLWWANFWSDNGKYTLYASGETINLTGDLTLYAKWTWFVHYDCGTGQYVHAEVGDGYQYTVATPAYQKTGLTFSHWEGVDGDGNSQTYYPGEKISLTSDLYMTAVWTGESIQLTGKVMDATVNGANYGNPIEGVTVEFFDSDGISAGTAVTNSNGVYTFTFSKYDTYSRTFTKSGYGSKTVDSLIINANTPSMGVSTMVESSENTPPVDEDRNIIADGTCGENLTWALDDAGLLTISGTGAMSDYNKTNMPWYPYLKSIYSVSISDGITVLGATAFYGCTEMKTVYMPETLVTISLQAFYDCDKLKTVKIPDSVTMVGYEAFCNCDNLESVIMGKNLKTIQGGGYGALGMCGQLATITVPDTLSSVDTHSLSNGTSIRKVIVPETVISIPENLYNMSSVAEFVSERTDGFGYFDDDGILYYKDPYTEIQTLVKCPQAMNLTDTYTVLAGTHIIGAKAFYNKDQIKNVVLPDGLTAIKEQAFYDCDLLETIQIPDTVTSVENNAFYHCDWIENVYLGKSLKDLGYRAFEYCGKLTTITVPDNLSINYSPNNDGGHPFYGSAVKTVIVPATVTSLAANLYNMDTIVEFQTKRTDGFGYFDDDGILYYKDPYTETQTLVKCPQAMNLTDAYTVLPGTHKIGANAFYNKDRVKNISLPDGLTDIGEYAFHDCDLLETIHVPDTVTSIASNAFYHCDWIDNVYLGKALTSIGSRTFESCGKLTTITVPDNLTVNYSPNSSGGHPFYGSPITTVIIPATVTSLHANLYNVDTVVEFQTKRTDGFGYFDDDGILYYKDPYTETQTLVKCPQAMNLTDTYIVLSGTHKIGARAFYNKDRLKNVNLPDGLTDIGEYAFHDCDLLETIHVPDTVTSIASNAFYHCDWIDNVYLGKALTSIGSRIFESCGKLTTITVPDNLAVNYSPNSSGGHPFYGSPITTVIIPATVTSLHANLYNMDTVVEFQTTRTDSFGYFDDDGILYYKDPYTETQTLVKCPQAMNLTDTYIVLSGTHKIGARAFYNKDRVKNVILPDGLINVDEYAFYDCDMLATIQIPDTVTRIGQDAFNSCAWLATVTIGEQVASIDRNAFSNCDKLVSVYFYGAAPSVGWYAFGAVNTNFMIYYLEGQSNWTSPTWNDYPTTPFKDESSEPGPYMIESIAIRDENGVQASVIPSGNFLATVSITNLSADGDAMVLLAAYTSSGQYTGLMYVSIEDCPANATIKLTLPVDNTSNNVAELKAFIVESFSNMQPLGTPATFVGQ